MVALFFCMHRSIQCGSISLTLINLSLKIFNMISYACPQPNSHIKTWAGDEKDLRTKQIKTEINAMMHWQRTLKQRLLAHVFSMRLLSKFHFMF